MLVSKILNLVSEEEFSFILSLQHSLVTSKESGILLISDILSLVKSCKI